MKTLHIPGKLLIFILMVALLFTGCSLTPAQISADSNANSIWANFGDTEAEDAGENALVDNTGDTVTISREEYERLERYSSLDDLAKVVEEYYYIEPDLDAMLDGAKRGLLAGLLDPYTYYYSPEEFSQMWEEDQGEYAGIGIQIAASYVTMMCTITRVFSDSPASEAGLRKGDILSKVNDMDVTAENLNDAVNIMRGTVGETVNVQVLRDDQLLDFVIPRAVVHVNWVSSCMLDQDVGYILLYEFSGDCAARFQEQVDALVDQGAKSLIIDLRDNPGGWIDDAVSIADIFLPKETITYLQYRDGTKEYYTATDGQLDIPLVLMMNENSASSSEILAGALQDYGIATVVGTQSYGKGIVQYVIPVGSDGAGMQLTTAQYFTPNGRSIHKIGITPDVESQLPEGDYTLYELGDLADVQLSKAYEIALQKANGTYVAPTPTTTPAETLAPEVTAAPTETAAPVETLAPGKTFTPDEILTTETPGTGADADPDSTDSDKKMLVRVS